MSYTKVGNVITFPDAERRSRNPDGVARPYDEPAVIFVFPVPAPKPDFDTWVVPPDYLQREYAYLQRELERFVANAYRIPVPSGELLPPVDFVVLPPCDA